MNSPKPAPRYLGMTRRELAVVAGLGILICAVVGSVVFIAGRLGPAVMEAISSAVPPTLEASRAPHPPTTTVAPTVAPTRTPVPTTTPTPPPTPTAMPEPGFSLTRPLPPAAVIRSAGWELRVLEVQRGAAAAEAVHTANQFNPPAPAGHEYMLVRVGAKSAHTDQASHRIYNGDFRLMGDRRIEYLAPAIVAPKPRLDAEVFTGGEVAGWLVFVTARDEGQLILIWDPISDSSIARQFLALTEGAALPIDPSLDQLQPSNTGRTRDAPAPLKDDVITDDWAVAVLDVVRGPEAWTMAHTANQFNPPPDEGLEYVAVYVRARYVGTQDSTARLNSSSFKTIGSTNVMHDAPPVVEPEPALNVTLFSGGVIEGWVIVQAQVGEKNLLLVFDPLFDSRQQNRRFLALTP